MIITGLGPEYRETYAEGEEPLILTNHYLEEDLQHLNPEEDFTSSDGVAMYWDTYPRYRILARNLKKKPCDFATARSILFHPEVTSQVTQQQLLMQPSSNTFQVWMKA